MLCYGLITLRPIHRSQETPYRLVYGSDAMIPIELSEPSLRTIIMLEESNELAQRAELDLIKEEREKARIKEEAIK